MNDYALYRKRLIPEECVLLKDDTILRFDEDIVVTSWQALKKRPDLSHGYSVYYRKEGYKISEFYRHDHSLRYFYCDIIDFAPHPDEENAFLVTDLLADVICYPDGRVRVMDLDELTDAFDKGLLSDTLLKKSLLSLNALLGEIYERGISRLTAPIEAARHGTI